MLRWGRQACAGGCQAIGGGQTQFRILVLRAVIQRRLGTLSSRISIESCQRFFGIAEKSVNLALNTLASHERLHM